MLAMAVKQSDTAENGMICSGAQVVTLHHLGAVSEMRAKVAHRAVYRQQMENLVTLAGEHGSILKSDSDARANFAVFGPN